MENTKVISLLKTFSKDEMKEFEKFIQSPFHSKDRDVKPLFNSIRKYYPEFNNPKFTKESVYKKLYPKEKYNDAKMRKLFSYLYKAGEQYLMQIAINKNKPTFQLMLLEELKERKMDSSFRALSKTLGDEIKMSKLQLSDYFYYKYELYKITGNYYYDLNDFEKSISMMEKEFNNMTALYLYVYQIISHQYESIRMHIDKVNFGVIEALNDKLDTEGFINSSIIKNEEINAAIPFYLLNKSFLNIDDLNVYKKAKDSVLKNLDRWSHDDKHTALNILLGTVSLRANFNREGTGKEAFDIISLIVKNKVYKAGNEKYMSLTFFRNAVSVSLDDRQFKWLEAFINDEIKELAPEYRENMKYYSLARLDHARKNYESALSNVNRVKYEIFIFKLDVIKLNLIILYELKQYEAARDFIDTSRKYFSRSKDLTEFYRESSVNFVKYFKLILNLIDKPDKITAEMNYKKLQKEKIITNKNWLLRRFEKLI